jgi:hypothetical protein
VDKQSITAGLSSDLCLYLGYALSLGLPGTYTSHSVKWFATPRRIQGRDFLCDTRIFETLEAMTRSAKNFSSQSVKLNL